MLIPSARMHSVFDKEAIKNGYSGIIRDINNSFSCMGTICIICGEFVPLTEIEENYINDYVRVVNIIK